MNGSIGERWETFVERIVRAGRYRSASEGFAKVFVWSRNVRPNCSLCGIWWMLRLRPVARLRMPTSIAPLKPRPSNCRKKDSDLPRLKMLPSAQADPVHILEHITRESGHLTIGRRFVGTLRQKCRDLAALPGTLGRARPELRPDLLFRYIGEAFEVSNIIEGHRDIEAL